MPFPGFTESQVEDIKKQALSFWDNSTKMMDPFFLKIADYERVSRVQLPRILEVAYEEHEDRSALVPADVYINLKSLSSHVNEILFSRKPYAVITERGKPNIQTVQTEKAQAKLQHMLDVADFESESSLATTQALVFGRGCVFTEWHQEFQRVVQRDEETQQIEVAEDGLPIFDNVPVAEYSRTRSIDIRRVRIDPSAEMMKDVRLAGYHSLRSVSELLVENNRSNFYDFKPKKLMESSFDYALYYEYIHEETDSMSFKGMENEDFGDKIAEEIRVYGLFRIKKGDSFEFHDLVVSIANRSLVIGLKRNDLPLNGWDLFDWPAVDEADSRMFPMGVVEPVMDAFLERHVKRNQAIDGTNRDTYDTYIGDKAACQELPDVIEHVPEQLLRVDLMASGARSIHEVIGPMQRPQRSHDPFREGASLSKEIQQIMRLSDYIQGLDPSATETATAVSEIVAGGAVLLKLLVNNLKHTFYRPCWQKQLILHNFFKGHVEEMITTQSGQEFQLNPGDLNALFQIDIEIATAMDRPAMIRRFVEMFPTLANDPFYDGYEIRKTANQVLQLPNADRILPPSDLQRKNVDNENIALGMGAPVPVHPLEPHQLHLQGHTEYIDFVNSPEGRQQGLTDKELIAHNELHEAEIEKQNTALGNTKDLGGNAGGYAVQPDMAAQKSRSGPGYGLKSESRG